MYKEIFVNLSSFYPDFSSYSLILWSIRYSISLFMLLLLLLAIILNLYPDSSSTLITWYYIFHKIMSFHLINLIVLFYLHSNVSYISGTGAKTNPFIIN